MILQELNRYYERKASDPESTIPSYGTSVENISFALVLNESGELLEVEDLRQQKGKNLRPRKMIVPAAEKKASGIKPNFLWDSTSYVLGLDDKGKQDRTDKCHEAFVQLVRSTCLSDDQGLKAVISFYDHNYRTIISRPNWEDICGSNLVFRLSGAPGYIHDREAARKAWARCLGQRKAANIGQCLISGENAQPIARLHPSIKGVRGAQSMGASIVSFNLPAFESYGKDQSINAPVGEKAAFNYVTALNTLLAPESRQKIVIGDTTVVFWAERPSVIEGIFADLFAPDIANPKAAELADDQQTADKIFHLLRKIRSGESVVDIVPDLDPVVRFFILGLTPNAARLSIRFWLEGTVGSFLEHIGTHFRQLEIVRKFDSDPKFPPLWRLLCQTATLGKNENILPVLAGGMAKAMLNGAPYPHSLLAAVLGRIRAEREVGYFRAALLKAYLVRNKKMEISMYYDPDRKEVPYILGGLFAVLEKAQNDAIPGTNATMKDRFFASAPATPARVFPMLLKNAANHTAKLRKDPMKTGWAITLEKSIQDAVINLTDFPPTLLPEEQGLFMIGYYQRMKDLYTSKKTSADTAEEN
ncbi:type I-C CRISPR-associated protein Cas8c/Csd1 [Desulfobulbus rhabdoformis]|uniref:type I-C CRISPR-associated protein Cas8c/Csd1 n=1 Tax=Desulfobulbus rhabdoformis TaxID=34032 RepID=UPI0019627377|nr:type I-C CRISPR-associated protein Cas8c/Csd1 [Desulfobulbus rhabdoformis]MBM9614800.1 type I-C CRISPR-associated protein Cas8c/Csd1 [Desulfobulbus rhabdoformis]